MPLNSTRTGAANLPNMENTSIFALSGFQYIIMSIVITKGYPYKKPLYYNGEHFNLTLDLFNTANIGLFDRKCTVNPFIDNLLSSI